MRNLGLLRLLWEDRFLFCEMRFAIVGNRTCVAQGQPWDTDAGAQIHECLIKRTGLAGWDESFCCGEQDLLGCRLGDVTGDAEYPADDSDDIAIKYGLILAECNGPPAVVIALNSDIPLLIS